MVQSIFEKTILLRFYLTFILILSWFYLSFILILSWFYSNSQYARLKFEYNGENQTWDPQNPKVDLLEGPKQPSFKSPPVDRTNKIFQKRFGIVLQLIFLSTKIAFTINKKWYLCEKNLFLFSGQVWKMPLGRIAKNGPKTQFHLKLPFFLLGQKIKSNFFVKKKSLLVF